MKKNIVLFALFGAIILFAPSFAFAQDINSLGFIIIEILNWVIRIIILLATVFFIWGVFTYIKGDKDAGKEKITQGLIGLFIIVAFWGVIRIVQNTFGLDNNNQLQSQDLPCIQGINC